MKLRVAWVQARPGKDKSSAIHALTAEYAKRISRYALLETSEHASEAAFAAKLSEMKSRPFTVLLDSRGRQMSSEELARFLAEHQTRGTQAMLFALGGADGWPAAMLRSADLTLSLGSMTLPHELARVVLLEQLYRAFTILQGHPYHSGH